MNYLLLTLKHKWFVFKIGRKLRVPFFQLLMHDWSKFFLWRSYNNIFFGDKSMDAEFERTWLYHQNHERHHWEYWIPRSSHNRTDATMERIAPVAMPERYVREMVADWMGAGRAYVGRYPNPGNWTWLIANEERIKKNVHPETWRLVQKVIAEL